MPAGSRSGSLGRQRREQSSLGDADRSAASGAGADRTRHEPGSRRRSSWSMAGEPRSAIDLGRGDLVDVAPAARSASRAGGPAPGSCSPSPSRRHGRVRAPAWRRSARGRSGTRRRSRLRSRAPPCRAPRRGSPPGVGREQHAACRPLVRRGQNHRVGLGAAQRRHVDTVRAPTGTPTISGRSRPAYGRASSLVDGSSTAMRRSAALGEHLDDQIDALRVTVADHHVVGAAAVPRTRLR